MKVGWKEGTLDHSFDPPYISNAKVGSVIIFEFFPKNHSVVLMKEGGSCIPYGTSDPQAKKDGKLKWSWSGWMPVADDWTGTPVTQRQYQITVTDNEPIWFYCSQTDSCTYYGMVGAINPKNGAADVEKQVRLAKEKKYALQVDEPIPAEGQEKNTWVSGNKTQDPNPDSDSKSGSSGLSGGAIAGIVIGAVGAFALVGLLFFFVGRRKKSKEQHAAAAATAAAAASAPAHNPHMSYDPGNPPMYQPDNRYSTMSGMSSPGFNDHYKPGHGSVLSSNPTGTTHDGFQERDPHRLSELASNTHDPVEIYTPELGGHPETPTSPRK